MIHTLSYERKSYNFNSVSLATANMTPSGSKAAKGLLDSLVKP